MAGAPAAAPHGGPGPSLVLHGGPALPTARRSLAGATVHVVTSAVPDPRLPLLLGEVHRSLAVGAPLEVVLTVGDGVGAGGAAAAWLGDVVTGAGFDVGHVDRDGDDVLVAAVRARTLADTVGAGMRLLVCGLNPSVLSADVGVGFARPGNRFWAAAIAAGIASRPRDPAHALRHHGTGMTDLVKRATVAAAELTAGEYRDGVARVERLCTWARPRAVCFVGLAGWRSAVDRRAVAGVQPDRFGGVPAYVMPSTSGLNAHSRPADLAAHLRAAADLADRGSRTGP